MLGRSAHQLRSIKEEPFSEGFPIIYEPVFTNTSGSGVTATMSTTAGCRAVTTSSVPKIYEQRQQHQSTLVKHEPKSFGPGSTDECFVSTNDSESRFSTEDRVAFWCWNVKARETGADLAQSSDPCMRHPIVDSSSSCANLRRVPWPLPSMSTASAYDRLDEIRDLCLRQAAADVRLACAQLRISASPTRWSPRDVQRWLAWLTQENKIEDPLDSLDYLMKLNGAELLDFCEDLHTGCIAPDGTEVHWKPHCRTAVETVAAHLEIWMSAVQSTLSQIEDASRLMDMAGHRLPSEDNATGPFTDADVFDAWCSSSSSLDIVNNTDASRTPFEPSTRPSSAGLSMYSAFSSDDDLSLQSWPPSPHYSDISYNSYTYNNNNNNNDHHKNKNSHNNNCDTSPSPSSLALPPAPALVSPLPPLNRVEEEGEEEYGAFILGQPSKLSSTTQMANGSMPPAEDNDPSRNNNNNCSCSKSSSNSSNNSDSNSNNNNINNIISNGAAGTSTKRIAGIRSSGASSHIHLWQFLGELLADSRHHATIRWLDRSRRIFKIEDSAMVARLWGRRKNRPAMNYDKLSRSIRQYYRKGIMRKTERSQRLVYQFCTPPPSAPSPA